MRWRHKKRTTKSEIKRTKIILYRKEVTCFRLLISESFLAAWYFFSSSSTDLVLSKVNKDDLAGVAVDSNGEKSIAFLKSINAILSGTPFELAYRALNELLISVMCFKPKNELELYAVWDDFLMTKVLPRLEGDSQKLKQETTDNQQVNLLTKLQTLVETSFKTDTDTDRPDLLRVKVASQAVGEVAEVANESTTINIAWRSVSKLDWMNKRLQSNGFTSYWP